MTTTLKQYPSGIIQYKVEFDYLARAFVVVTLVNSVDNSLNKVLRVNDDYKFLNATTIEVTASQDGFDIVQIHRETQSELIVGFQDGSVLTAGDLTTSELQAIHIAEEGRDQAVERGKQYADSAKSSADKAAATEQDIEDLIANNNIDSTLRSDLSSTGDGKGASMVMYKASGTGAVDRSLKEKMLGFYVDALDYITPGSADYAPGINLAIAEAKKNGGGTVILPKGVLLCNSAIDMRGAYVNLRGHGIGATVLKANFTGTSLITADESADARISPMGLYDMTIDANRMCAHAFRYRFRHLVTIRGVLMTGGTNAVMHARDSWLGMYDQCDFEGSTFGVWLAGSNHRSMFHGCSFQGCDNRTLVIANGSDGNSGLLFNNCDFEFSSMHGMQISCTDATFNGCYIGENMGQAVIEMYAGNVRVNGGTAFWGFTAATPLVYATGGNIVFTGVTLNGQTYAGISNMVDGTGGKVSFRECPTYCPVPGPVTLPFDCLANGPTMKVFAPRLGMDWTAYGINATVTEAVTNSGRTVTAAAVPGPNSIIGLRANLTDMQWRDGEKWAVIVTYSSNVDINIRVAAAAAGSGTYIGTLPATGGAVKTCVLYHKTSVRTTATVMELYRDTVVAVGHTFTLYDISFGDSRALGKDFGGAFANLYKF